MEARARRQHAQTKRFVYQTQWALYASCRTLPAVCCT
jgi:hypothetical protein